MISVENVKNQTYEPCEISQNGDIKGNYFVNLNATPQDPIILIVTNQLGKSEFHRFKPQDFSKKQISNEPTTVRINFKAHPQPTDCQWRLVAEINNQSCKESLKVGIKGDYFVDLSATSE